MKDSFFGRYWTTIFIILCGVWAFWGCWRIKELMFDNFDALATLETTIRQELPNFNWAIKGVFGLTFIIGYLYWVTFPLQIMLFWWTIKSSEKTSLTGKLTDAFKETFGQAIGLTTLLVFWLLGTLFLAFFGGLIDLAGILVLVAVIIYSLILGLTTRKKKKTRYSKK